MRSILFVLAIAITTACTSSTRPGVVNVAAVRNQISGTIRSSTNDRSIHSMGKVTPDRAVVYTTSKDGTTKQEEVWVKRDGAWHQESATQLSAAPATVTTTAN